MTKKELYKKISYLEFVNDQLNAELDYLDNVLKSIGFPKGLESAKLIAKHMIEEENE